MKAWERWSLGVLSAVVAISGFAYLWMKYFVESADPFSVVNHPWQPAMLTLHVLASPPLVLVFGIILNSHVMKKLRATNIPNRRSGLISFTTFFLMVATGYLLQVVTAEGMLQFLVVLHVGSGALFSVAYVIHLIVSLQIARKLPRRVPEAA